MENKPGFIFSIFERKKAIKGLIKIMIKKTIILKSDF